MTQKEYTFNLMLETDMILYTKEIRELCPTFSCGNGENEQGLNDFFENDADLYREELIGKTYCFLTRELPHRIVWLFTISNDSIKTTHLGRSTTNRLNRGIETSINNRQQ